MIALVEEISLNPPSGVFQKALTFRIFAEQARHLLNVSARPRRWLVHRIPLL